MDIKKPLTRQELIAMENALFSDEQTGRKDAQCVRCGTRLEVDNTGSSYTVTCQTPNCVKYTIRGI